MANGLYQAVQECRYQQVKFLVESGLSLKGKNGAGHNLLVAALHVDDAEKREKMFKFLLRKGADWKDLDEPTGKDMLQWACCLDRAAEAQLLLSEGAGDWDLSRLDKAGFSALHYVTMHNNADLLQQLCNTAARFRLTVDIRDTEGFTPYMHAKRLGYETCAEILLEEGSASPEQFDSKHYKAVVHWTRVGADERRRKARRRRRKAIATYKTLGRLPELKAVQFDLAKVQIVESKLDKSLLGQYSHEDWAFPLRRVYKTLKTSECSPFEENRRTSYNEAVSLLTLTTATHESEHCHFKDSLSDPEEKEDNYRVLLQDLMQVLTQECTQGFRRPAAPPAFASGTPRKTKTTKSSSLAATMTQDRKHRAQLLLSRKLSKSPTRHHRRMSPHKAKGRSGNKVAEMTPVPPLPVLKEQSQHKESLQETL